MFTFRSSLLPVLGVFAAGALIQTKVEAFTLPSLPRSRAVVSRSCACIYMSTVLRPTNGGDDLPIEKDAAIELDGCKVGEKSGRYFCIADESSGEGAKIGTNTLSPGVSYGLNVGMKIITADGVEYEVTMEGGGLPTDSRDPVMGMMFDAMKAQFGAIDDDDNRK